MDEVIKVLDEALEKAGLSDAAASQLAANNPSVIKNLRLQRGSEKRYNYSTLKKLAEVLNLELYFGPPRESGPIVQGNIDGATYAAIRRMDVSAAAGHGAENHNEDVVGTLAFRRDWLLSKGISASNAVLITVRGDSMEPLIQDGDLVMVDTSKVVPEVNQFRRRAEIYALVQDEVTRIKWVERTTDTTMVLFSQNSARYTPEVFVENEMNAITFVGKVVWWGHSVN